MNARHRNLHSSVRRRNYAVVIFILQATEVLTFIIVLFRPSGKVAGDKMSGYSYPC